MIEQPVGSGSIFDIRFVLAVRTTYTAVCGKAVHHPVPCVSIKRCETG
jgi:hypothetical protein